jgi:hypothetical protein
MQTNSDLVWGTYGKGGVEHCAGRCPLHPLQWVKLVDRETSHLQAILRTQRQIRYTVYQRVIESILKDRGEKPETFSFEAERELFRKMSAAEARFRQNSL